MDQSETLLGEMLLLNLLGRALYLFPDREWLESLIAQDVFEEAPFASEQPAVRQGLAALQGWSRALRGGIPAAAFAELCADATNLFAHPAFVQAPPWESVYFNESRMVFQEQTIQVRAWYARFGLQVELRNQEPDDQIGLELTFLAHLAGLALQALQQGDAARLAELAQAQHDFVAQHLAQWAPAWCGLVLQNAKTDYYRGLAWMVSGALAELAERLGIPLPEGA